MRFKIKFMAAVFVAVFSFSGNGKVLPVTEFADFSKGCKKDSDCVVDTTDCCGCHGNGMPNIAVFKGPDAENSGAKNQWNFHKARSQKCKVVHGITDYRDSKCPKKPSGRENLRTLCSIYYPDGSGRIRGMSCINSKCVFNKRYYDYIRFKKPSDRNFHLGKNYSRCWNPTQCRNMVKWALKIPEATVERIQKSDAEKAKKEMGPRAHFRGEYLQNPDILAFLSPGMLNGSGEWEYYTFDGRRLRHPKVTCKKDSDCVLKSKTCCPVRTGSSSLLSILKKHENRYDTLRERACKKFSKKDLQKCEPSDSVRKPDCVHHKKVKHFISGKEYKRSYCRYYGPRDSRLNAGSLHFTQCWKLGSKTECALVIENCCDKCDVSTLENGMVKAIHKSKVQEWNQNRKKVCAIFTQSEIDSECNTVPDNLYAQGGYSLKAFCRSLETVCFKTSPFHNRCIIKSSSSMSWPLAWMGNLTGEEDFLRGGDPGEIGKEVDYHMAKVLQGYEKGSEGWKTALAGKDYKVLLQNAIDYAKWRKPILEKEKQEFMSGLTPKQRDVLSRTFHDLKFRTKLARENTMRKLGLTPEQIKQAHDLLDSTDPRKLKYWSQRFEKELQGIKKTEPPDKDKEDKDDKDKPPFITTLIYKDFENLAQFTEGCKDKSDCGMVSGNCCPSGSSGAPFAILKKKKEEYWKTRFSECKKRFGHPEKLNCPKTGKYNVGVACVNSKCVTQPQTTTPGGSSGSR